MNETTTQIRYFARASELYDPATGSRIAAPSFLLAFEDQAADADVRAAVEEAGL